MILSSYERMIARRYLLPGRGEAFIFLVAGFSLGAVMLGVAALIVVMSVMNGFRADLFDKIVGFNGHAVIQGYNGQLRDWRKVEAQAKATKGITSAIPLIQQPLMAGFEGRNEGVLVRGMTVNDITHMPILAKNVKLGSLSSLTPGSNTVAIGSGLAEALGATVGDNISLLSLQGHTTPFGTMPRIVSYRVGAIFEVGLYDYDKAFVVMPMQDAQTLLMMGDSVSMIEVKTVDPDRVGQIMAPLAAKVVREAQVTDWRQLNSSLFEAISVDRTVSFTVISIILLVASFNIVSSLIMLVRAKTRDIAVLRTMGATRAGLMKIFVTVGTTIGSLGIIAGLILGALLIFFRQDIIDFIGMITGQPIWDPKIRFVTELPAKTDPFQVIGVVVMAFSFSVLATLYPAWKAATTDPVQVLRYE